VVGAGEIHRTAGLKGVGATLRAIDGIVDRLTQGIAAFLVLAEIVILFAGVVWRYLLNDPLIWGDELAGSLFLWLVSLGAVIALRRGEHMRMTVVVGRLGPRAQSEQNRDVGGVEDRSGSGGASPQRSRAARQTVS